MTAANPGSRPTATLGRVLDSLGATLLEVVHAGPVRPADLAVGGIAIHDPADEPMLPPSALVLGIGVTQPEEVVALLTKLGQRSAAGLVLRAPAPAGSEVRAAAEGAGVAVLALTRGAAWTQLAAMLRSLLAEGDIGDPERDTIGGIPSGDLFALANAISALLDAPVTIEDRSSRVLAFSGRQDEADASRVETILGRQVPEKYARMLAEQGVFGELYRSDQPLFLPPTPNVPAGFVLPRVAVAVRAGDEVLGSIWAAVGEPLSPERSQALHDAAKLVALHMLRIRAGDDVERRLRADLVGTALEGGPAAAQALSRLGLTDQPVSVLALTLVDTVDPQSIHIDAERAAQLHRLADAFAIHLSAVHPRCASALVGDIAYGLVPVIRDQDGIDRALRIAAEFLERVGSRASAAIGVGTVASDVAGLSQARAAADRVLRVLRRHDCSRRVGQLDDSYADVMMLELQDLLAASGDRPAGPISRLLDYDAQHNSNLVETLHAWLDAFGDVVAAAAASHVHQNTFRYRLRRLSESGGIDLNDPDVRFAAMLELRLIGYRRPDAQG